MNDVIITKQHIFQGSCVQERELTSAKVTPYSFEV